MVSKVTVHAPCSTANVGPGFDVFALALDAFYDKVTLEVVNSPKLEVETRGTYGSAIPLQAEANSAGLVVKKMIENHRVNDGLKMTIEKEVPPGYGLGSSAASAAAASLCFNSLFDLNLDDHSLIKYAGAGEVASAGTMHYDNVSASILGGFVIVKSDSFNVTRIDPPRDLALCVAIPMIDVPQKKTEVARSVLPSQVSLKQLTSNVADASTLAAGFVLKDVELICRSINDAVVEPARKQLIPGYEQVKKNALSAGALAVTISGAGPSIISFAKVEQNLDKILESMADGFKSVNINCKTISCRASDGAQIIQKE